MWDLPRPGLAHRVPCISRQILNHCATREALKASFDKQKFLTLMESNLSIFSLWLVHFMSSLKKCCLTQGYKDDDSLFMFRLKLYGCQYLVQVYNLAPINFYI